MGEDEVAQHPASSETNDNMWSYVCFSFTVNVFWL